MTQQPEPTDDSALEEELPVHDGDTPPEGQVQNMADPDDLQEQQ